MAHKRLNIIIFGFTGLVIASLSIHIGFEYLITTNEWLGFIIGIGIMLLSILIYQFGKRHEICYHMSFVFNMIGIGLTITAYYVFKAYSLTFVDFLVAILVSLGMLILFSLLSRINIVKRHHKLFLSLYIGFTFIISLGLWLSSEVFTGLSFYFLNVIYFFMIGIVKTTASFKDVSKEMAWISFGAFILISIIILIVLSEGEALSSGFDGISTGGRKKNKKNATIT